MYVYSVEMRRVAVSGAITLLQYKASANNAAYLISAWCSQSTVTTSTLQTIEVLRKTGAATVTTFTPVPQKTNDPAALGVGSTSGTGTNASSEGTDGNILRSDVFNLLTGWLYVPTPEERQSIAPGGVIAIKLPLAPGISTTFTCGFMIGEEQG